MARSCREFGKIISRVISINAQVPARTVEAENFPGTRDAGATVPVVIGRALQHPCHHLASGYELLLAETPPRFQDFPAFGDWDGGVAITIRADRPHGITAIDETTWLLVSANSYKIYKTTDSGANWDDGTDLPLTLGTPRGIANVEGAGGTEWLVLDDGDNEIYKTTDSGANWYSGIALPAAATAPHGIAAVDDVIWLVLDKATRKIYKTTDGGSTWDSGVAVPVAATAPQGIAAYQRGLEITCFVADATTDKIYKTTDSGTTWDAGLAVPAAANLPTGLAIIPGTIMLLSDNATDKIYVRHPRSNRTIEFKHGTLDAATLKKYFPIAVGDRLSVGIGEQGTDGASLTETVRVTAVTLPAAGPPSVTLEKPLANTHTVTTASGNNPAVDVIVVNHDVVRDYLLGEGIAEDPADSTREINFRRAYRAYHDGRALPFHQVDEPGVLLKFSATPGDRIVTLAVDDSGINTNSDPLFGYTFNYRYRAEGVNLTDSAAVPSDGGVSDLTNDKEYTFFLIAEKTGSPTFYATLEVTPGTTDTTAVNGQALVLLPVSLQAPLEDWYRGFVVDLVEDAQDPETRALRVESYQADIALTLPENSIQVRAPSANFSFARYSMREYRFFDGSQTSPYPGFAFMRFAVNYDGEIRADAQGFALERPQDFIRELLRNDTWGGKETGTFHLPATADPQPPATVKLEVSLTSAARAYSILDQADRVRPFHLFRRPDGVHIEFPEGLTPSRYMLPGLSRYASPSPRLEFMTQGDRATRLAVKFRPDPLSGEFRGTLAEAGTDGPVEIEMPYVYDAETARQCLWFERALRDSRMRVMRVAVPRGRWRAEDIIRESEPLLGKKAGIWRVIEAQERVGVVQMLLLGWLEDAGAGIFSWTPPDNNWPFAGWNRDIHVGAPATDWSKTPPPPVTAPELVLTNHNEDRSICEISFSWLYSDPLDNVHGVQIEVAVDQGASVIAKEIHERIGRGGSTTIEAVQCEHDAVVKILSTTLNNNLKGFPVLLNAPLAQRFIHVATSSSKLSSEPSVTSVSFKSNSSRRLYVKLPKKPTQNVTVGIAKTGTVGISKTTMTFTPTTWGTAQSVVLSGSAGSGTVTFTAASLDSTYQGKTASVNVSISSVYVPPPVTPQLPTPGSLSFTKSIPYKDNRTYIRWNWNSVAGATSYLYEYDWINDDLTGNGVVSVTNKTLTKRDFVSGDLRFRVKARGTGYLDSEWSPWKTA